MIFIVIIIIIINNINIITNITIIIIIIIIVVVVVVIIIIIIIIVFIIISLPSALSQLELLLISWSFISSILSLLWSSLSLPEVSPLFNIIQYPITIFITKWKLFGTLDIIKSAGSDRRFPNDSEVMSSWRIQLNIAYRSKINAICITT